MATIDILREARARIEKGWCQHMLQRIVLEGVEYCAAGALCQDSSRGDESEPHRLLRECLPFPSYRYEDIARFNDAPTTKKADVLALYDRAIEKAAECSTSDAAS